VSTKILIIRDVTLSIGEKKIIFLGMSLKLKGVTLTDGEVPVIGETEQRELRRRSRACAPNVDRIVAAGNRASADQAAL